MKISVATVRTTSGLLCGIVCGLLLTSSHVFALGMLPVLSLVSPGNGSTMSGTMTMMAAADAEGLVSLQFKVDGNNAGSLITAGSCRATFDTTTVPDGAHSVQAVAQDQSGAMTVSPATTVFVSNAALAASLLPPAPTPTPSPTPAPALTPSADCTKATTVVDGSGAVWTFDALAESLRNNAVTPGAHGSVYSWVRGQLYMRTLNPQQDWAGWNGANWVFMPGAPEPTCGNTVSGTPMPTPTSTPLPSPTPTPTPTPTPSPSPSPSPTPTPTPTPSPSPTPTSAPTSTCTGKDPFAKKGGVGICIDGKWTQLWKRNGG